MAGLLELYTAFFRIGIFTFGGGMAMLPMLERELVEKRHWVTEDEILDYYAIGQCTPGVIAVNTATFVGKKLRGNAGAAVATFGMVSPSLIIITIIAMVLSNFAHIPAVQHALAGIRVGVCAIVLSAIIKLGKKSIVDVWTALIYAAVVVLMTALDVSPVFFVIGAAVIGILVKLKGVKAK